MRPANETVPGPGRHHRLAGRGGEVDAPVAGQPVVGRRIEPRTTWCGAATGHCQPGSAWATREGRRRQEQGWHQDEQRTVGHAAMLAAGGCAGNRSAESWMSSAANQMVTKLVSSDNHVVPRWSRASGRIVC